MNIPIVSQLAKEAQLRETKSKKSMTTKDKEMDREEAKRKINDFIEKNEDELETHFVENPFIKIREKASRKQVDSKIHMGATDLQEDADTTAQQDIYFHKEENKFMIQDLEQMDVDKIKQKELKRKRRDAFGYGEGEDISDDDSDDDKAGAKGKRN